MLRRCWPFLTRALLLPSALTCRELLLQLGKGGGGIGGGFSRLLMQRDNSPVSITPKRTARKRVKADSSRSGVKLISSFSTVEGQQQNDSSRDYATLREDWQKFCKTEIPELVRIQMRTIKEMELELGEELVFGGPRGSLKGQAEVALVERRVVSPPNGMSTDENRSPYAMSTGKVATGPSLSSFGVPFSVRQRDFPAVISGAMQGRPGAIEDHRHRAFYQTLSGSEEKLQNFAARQLACRVLGSKGYACEDCWLPIVDCMCRTFERGTIYGGVCLWLYMHPKDFLRKNNTGKLLWQVFGDAAARLTVCGVQEQEEAMWKVFERAGRDRVWCVFPENTPPDYRVVDIPIPDQAKLQVGVSNAIHLLLIDGTWSNSKSMVSRLRERAIELWGEGGMPSVALSPTEVSVMHDLRPQPSTERTCTAAAAAQLLLELSMRSELAGTGLDQSARLLDLALESLNSALITRRSRDGRTTSRAERVYLRSGRVPL